MELSWKYNFLHRSPWYSSWSSNRYYSCLDSGGDSGWDRDLRSDWASRKSGQRAVRVAGLRFWKLRGAHPSAAAAAPHLPMAGDWDWVGLLNDWTSYLDT